MLSRKWFTHCIFKCEHKMFYKWNIISEYLKKGMSEVPLRIMHKDFVSCAIGMLFTFIESPLEKQREMVRVLNMCSPAIQYSIHFCFKEAPHSPRADRGKLTQHNLAEHSVAYLFFLNWTCFRVPGWIKAVPSCCWIIGICAQHFNQMKKKKKNILNSQPAWWNTEKTDG